MTSPRTRIVIGVALTVTLVVVALFAFVPGRAQTVSYGTVIVNTAFLNVRAGPGSEYLVMGVVKGGTRLPARGVTADVKWWEVETQFGDGFVYAEYVLFQGDPNYVPIVGASADAAPQPPQAIVLAPALNVRSGPNRNFSVLGIVPQQFVMTITGQNVLTGWYQVISPFGLGYIANEEVALGGDTSNIPRIEGISGVSSGVDGLATLLIPLPGGAEPTGGGGGGPLTTTTGGFPPLVTAPEANDDGEPLLFVPTGFSIEGVVEWEMLGARCRPDPSNPVLITYVDDDVITITGRNGESSWLQVSTTLGPLWVREAGVDLSTDVLAVVPTVPIVNDEALHLLEDPNLVAACAPPPEGLVPGTTTVAPTTTTTTTTTTTGATGGTIGGAVVIVNTSSLNVRSGPGAQFTIIGVADGGTEMPVTGIHNGWWRVNSPFGVGWVFSEFVVFRGESSNVPVIN